MATSKKSPAPAAASPKASTGKALNSVAVRKPAAGNIVSITEALKAQAEGMGSRVAPPTGNGIRITQDKHFMLPDGTKTQGPLQLVVVDFVTRHMFYEGSYDPKNVVPPGCFAIGSNPKDMTPSDNSPNKQSTDCQGCPMNQFGSDGDGKACKNTRLLAVLPPDADENTPIWTLGVSPTALKNFDGFVQATVRAFGLPPIGVIVNVGFDDAVTYAKLTFSEPVPNPQLNEMFARQGEAKELLMVEPDVSGYVPISKKAPVKTGGRR
jgi:hypothetical protein